MSKTKIFSNTPNVHIVIFDKEIKKRNLGIRLLKKHFLPISFYFKNKYKIQEISVLLSPSQVSARAQQIKIAYISEPSGRICLFSTLNINKTTALGTICMASWPISKYSHERKAMGQGQDPASTKMKDTPNTSLNTCATCRRITSRCSLFEGFWSLMQRSLHFYLILRLVYSSTALQNRESARNKPSSTFWHRTSACSSLKKSRATLGTHCKIRARQQILIKLYTCSYLLDKW